MRSGQTPHGEKPQSVDDYEHRTGKAAQDRQIAFLREQGVDVSVTSSGISKARVTTTSLS